MPISGRTSLRWVMGSLPKTATSPELARETFDDFQRGGFAGAIGAEQSVDLAAVEVEVEIIHCFEFRFSSFIGLVQVVYLQDLL